MMRSGGGKLPAYAGCRPKNNVKTAPDRGTGFAQSWKPGQPGRFDEFARPDAAGGGRTEGIAARGQASQVQQHPLGVCCRAEGDYAPTIGADQVDGGIVYLKPHTVESIEEILRMSSSRCIGKHMINAVPPTVA
jgi:hypothetical protein